MAKPNFTLPNKPAIKSGSILSYNYTDDFTFVPAPLTFNRDSAATRVNEKGLIEDVGYFGPELVQNGDFSEIGPELVTNGDFATDSDWTKGLGWSIANGKASNDGSVSGNDYLINSASTSIVGKTYKVVFTISDYVQGTLRVRAGQASSTYINANGTYTQYQVSTSTETVRVQARDNFIGSIDNISVKEVGQNWTLGSFTSIGNNVANIVNSTGELSLQQNIGVSQKTIKLTYTISNYSSGGIRPQYGAVNGLNRSANGTYTEIITGANVSSNLSFFSITANTTASITNISVIEILGDKPRIDYSGSLTEPSLLLEPQSTNLVTYSEDFSQWNRVDNVTLTTDITVKNPDGTDSTKLTKDSSSVAIVSDDGISILASTTYVFSFFVKKGNYDIVKAEVGSGSNNVNVSYTFSTDSFSTSESGTQTLISVDSSSFENDWKRIRIVFTGTITSVNSTLFILNSINDYVYYFGAQLEALSYATSYIPTEGSTATRLGETANNAGDVNVFNSEEGVLYAEISALADDGTFRQLTISDSSTSDRISIDFTSTSNQIRSFCSSGGSTVANMTGTVTDVKQFNKVAVKYKLNDYALWINGVEVATDTSASTPTGLKELAFDNSAGSNSFKGKVKNLQVFNKALTDRELEILTIQ